MPVHTKEQIFSLLDQHHQQLAEFGVHQVGIFGSFVRNTPHQQSDVDILVEFVPEQKTFDNFMHLALFLEDLFGRQIDLVTKESLSPYIGPMILREVEYVTISPRIPATYS